ncbi:MAG: DUF3857 domain-containing protein [Deltaproteobacteria bacterium]|nr:DUF3857 domain-containing protein [Deltaproteobacteria bacterium]
MRPLPFLAFALALAGGCGSATLRTAERGAAAPLFGPRQDLEGALVAKRRREPRDPRTAYLLALVRELRGKPRDALDMGLGALELASRSNDPLAWDLGEAAAYLVEDLDDVAPGWASRVLPVARRLVQRPGNIGPEATHVLSEILIRLGQRRADAELTRFGIERSGCVTDFLVAGPFGPWQLLGFDDVLGPELPGAPAGTVDLGPGRGTQPMREVHARGCAANVGGTVPQGGTFYATSFVELDRTTEVVVRVESPNAVKLLVNDRAAFTRDALRGPVARIDLVPVVLPAGRSKLTIKLSTRHPNPVVVLSIFDATTFAPAGRRGIDRADSPYRRDILVERARQPEGSLARMIAAATAADGEVRWDELPAFERLLAAAVSLSRGDVVRARESLRTLAARPDAPAVVTAIAAFAALQDPALPEDARRDRARRLLGRTAERDPDLWIAPYQLARLEMAEDRTPRAIELLETALARFPAQVEIPLLLSDVLAGEGWEADALEQARRARRTNPDACRPIQTMLGLRRRTNAVLEAERLTRELAACDRASDTDAMAHMQARRWQEAERELGRLLAMQPDNVGLLSLLADARRGAGSLEEAYGALGAILELRPGSGEAVLRRGDIDVARGRASEARAELARALALRPGETSELRRPLAALEATTPMSAYRLDGASVIREFLASGRSYEAPAVLVLDYTVVRVWSDGSSLELTHNVIRVQSPEGIERYGEFQPPDGAELLSVRTVKADGTRLEPEQIAGKDSLSLPNLAPGDFVEYEYVVAREPPSSFPGGFYGDRFFFRSFDTPFDRSELHVVAPRSMDLEVDPRGAAPPAEITDEGPLRAYHFRAREMRPIVAEPRAASSREFLPSVLVSRRATWSSMVNGMLDGLADKIRADPEITRLARRIAGPEGALGPAARAQRVYAWVIREVEDGGDPFAQASEVVIRKNGNRARALHCLLQAAGIPASLALVRDAAADQTRTSVANGETFEHLIVRIDLPDGPRWVSTFDDGAPFGYLPASIRGQPALGLARGAPLWRTGVAPEGTDRRDVEISLTLDRDAGGEARVVEKCRGAAAVAWRRILRQIPTAELRQKFEQVYLGRVVEGAELLDLAVDGATDPQAPLVLRYRWRARSVARRVGQRMLLRALYATLLSPELARSPLRSLPMVVDDVVDLHVDARISLPAGFELEPTLPDVSVDGWFGRFHSRVFAAAPGEARLERSIYVSPARIAADRYPIFAGFCRAADQAQLAEIPLREDGR